MPADPYRPVHLQQAVHLAAALVGQLRPQAEGGLVDGPFGAWAARRCKTVTPGRTTRSAFKRSQPSSTGRAPSCQEPARPASHPGLEVAAGRSPPAQVPFDGHDVSPTGVGAPGVAAKH